MKSAKTASRDSNLRSTIFPLQKRHKFIDQVTLILHMPPDPRSRMHTLVVPTLRVHTIHAKHLQLSRIDLPRQRANHPRIFILKKTSHRTGKDKQRLASVPEDQSLHVP